MPENLCFSGTNQKPEWRRPFGTGLVRHCPQGLFSPFFTFLRSIYIFPPVKTFPRPHYLPLGLRGCLHLVVLQKRQRTVQKKCDARTKLLFCLFNLLLTFLTFSLPSPRRTTFFFLLQLFF